MPGTLYGCPASASPWSAIAENHGIRGRDQPSMAIWCLSSTCRRASGFGISKHNVPSL